MLKQPTWIRSGYPPNALVFQQSVEDDFSVEELAVIRRALRGEKKSKRSGVMTGFTSSCVEQFSTPKEQAAAKVLADELQVWARDNLPMGCSARQAEKLIKRGLGETQIKLMSEPQKYGIDPVTILTVVSALLSIVSKLVQWWRS